jgi:hypothetical protein
LRKFIQPFGITNINLEDPSNLPVILELLVWRTGMWSG